MDKAVEEKMNGLIVTTSADTSIEIVRPFEVYFHLLYFLLATNAALHMGNILLLCMDPAICVTR